MNSFSLSGKTALVTGAAGLLGKHHCEALASAGATVIAVDVERDPCEALARSLGGEAMGFAMDVTQPKSIQQVLEVVGKKHAGIDVLVNNAAINDKFETPSLAAENSRFENYPL